MQQGQLGILQCVEHKREGTTALASGATSNFEVNCVQIKYQVKKLFKSKKRFNCQMQLKWVQILAQNPASSGTSAEHTGCRLKLSNIVWVKFWWENDRVHKKSIVVAETTALSA